MSSSSSKRVFLLVVAFLLFVSYLNVRDSIRVQCKLTDTDVRAIVRGLEEWSTPKLFRHIEIESGPEGTMLARVREPGGRWSVTVFRKEGGVWKKCAWYLVKEDTTGWIKP